MAECILYDRECIECGECNRCDLDPDKVCDNCKRCLHLDADYLAVHIDGVLTDEERLSDEEEGDD